MCSTTVLLPLVKFCANIFYHFLSPRVNSSGWTQTPDLGTMRQMFHHSDFAAGKLFSFVFSLPVQETSMELYHALDGVTNLKYKLLYFLTPNKKFKEKGTSF